jgi:ADP-heptose:LPS heptosyltransferase
MDVLLALLPDKPWRVFAGDLNLVQLAAVIQLSALHLCGDTGTLHLGLMTGTRTVSWFRPKPGICPWTPVGARHRTVLGKTEPVTDRLFDVPTSGLVQAALEVMEAEKYRGHPIGLK